MENNNINKLIKRFKNLCTPAISDALDKLGIRGGCEGIKPLFYGVKAVGPAVTLKYLPVSLKKETVGDYIDDIEEGSVLVLDNNGRTDCTVWGGILTIAAKSRKISGTVIDGVCRDVEIVRELNYPLWSKGHFMVTGKDRVGLAGFNVPVSLGRVRVNPEDLIVGDDSGVVVVPREKIMDVLTLSEEIEDAENKIVKSIKSGLSLREARKRYHYHDLQKRKQDR
jgi:4-hydroxy-4-methyl-2-oxoglutarate aldolase